MEEDTKVGLVTDYVNITYAAEYLKRSKSMIELHISAGRLKAYEFPGHASRLILRRDLDELLKIPRYGGRRDSNDE